MTFPYTVTTTSIYMWAFGYHTFLLGYSTQHIAWRLFPFFKKHILNTSHFEKSQICLTLGISSFSLSTIFNSILTLLEPSSYPHEWKDMRSAAGREIVIVWENSTLLNISNYWLFKVVVMIYISNISTKGILVSYAHISKFSVYFCWFAVNFVFYLCLFSVTIMEW